MAAGKKVAILGGGIAGLSAAHELVERGFEVDVFERQDIPGGKARSMAAQGHSFSSAVVRVPGQLPLPGEHGFRFFPGFYRHIVHTMARIPYRAGTVAQNLVDAREVSLTPFDRPAVTLPARFPLDAAELELSVFASIAALSGRVGVSLSDGYHFATKIWQLLTSCEERRYVEYEQTSWWQFIDASERSDAYRKYFADGITRSLVAAKALRASTKTIGDIFTQLMFDMLSPGKTADRLLNGPTNDVWIDPWLEYLEARGVGYHRGAVVEAIRAADGEVRSARITQRGGGREVTADYFIAALPVERMLELIGPDLVALDPSLANLDELSRCVEWMNGIQYYLNAPLPVTAGHVIYVDSPWALTSVSQGQFWSEFDLARCSDGKVCDILSVDISDWQSAGLNGKEARHCSRREIANETWEQLKRSLNASAPTLRDDMLHSWFLDPDIEDMLSHSDPSPQRRNTNLEPLLVNYTDTWRLRPEAVTRIRNLFLASDYVRTYTDLATMEAANEAARRAVNGVLYASGSIAAPCEVWNLHQPELFELLRAHDRVRYRHGLPWDRTAVTVGNAGAALATASAAWTSARWAR